jgi:hypothetical protein
LEMLSNLEPLDPALPAREAAPSTLGKSGKPVQRPAQEGPRGVRAKVEALEVARDSSALAQLRLRSCRDRAVTCRPPFRAAQRPSPTATGRQLPIARVRAADGNASRLFPRVVADPAHRPLRSCREQAVALRHLCRAAASPCPTATARQLPTALARAAAGSVSRAFRRAATAAERLPSPRILRNAELHVQRLPHLRSQAAASLPLLDRTKRPRTLRSSSFASSLLQHRLDGLVRNRRAGRRQRVGSVVILTRPRGRR